MTAAPEPGPPGFDAFCAAFLMRLPPDLAASFDRRQLFAVWQAFGPWQGRERRRGRHFRLRLPWRSWRVSVAEEE